MASPSTLILSADDLRVLVARVGLSTLMDELIERLVVAFADFDDATSQVPARAGFHYSVPEPGLLEWMPVMMADTITIKLVGYHPRNPVSRGLPTILGTIGSWDQRTGHLQALVDGSLVTAWRTGAASAVATQYLATEEGGVLGLIGAGAQAVTQAHAISRVRQLSRIVVCDPRPDVAQTFPARVAFLGVPVDVVAPDERSRVVAESDILCTCTSVGIGQGPVFADEGLKPWVHINAVGSDFQGKVEVPVTVLRRALVVPDTLEQCRKEGECQQLAPAEIGPRLASVVKHPERYADARSGITVFDSTGWAVEDQVALGLLVEYARRLELGRDVAIEVVSADPYDPYHGMVTSPDDAARVRAGGNASQVPNRQD